VRRLPAGAEVAIAVRAPEVPEGALFAAGPEGALSLIHLS